MIIRGENVTEIATLNASRQLHFIQSDQDSPTGMEEACKEAFHKGEKQGEKLGYERARVETKSLLHVLQTLSQKLLEHKHHLLEQMKPEVVEFAISVCERIIRKELSQPEALVKLINSLISYAASMIHNDAVQLILAPDDLVMLESYLASIHYDKREIGGVSFRTDPLMQRGDCRLETRAALLNYTISRQLTDLQSKVLQG